MIEILDTTLRDGMQGCGVTYSLQDKLQIIEALRSLNIDLIEIGNPSASDLDKELANIAIGDDLVLFGATKRKNIGTNDDKDLLFLASSPIKNISIFGKASLSQATEVLGVSPQENLKLIHESVRFLVQNGKNVLFDAEHFYSGYQENSEYALSVIYTARDAGARLITLCDTNGGTMLDAISDITKDVIKRFPDTKFGIHCHNDCGLAVAQTMLAISQGITHAQGTLLGVGERCGNTNLSTLIPNLAIKEPSDITTSANIANLYEVAHKIASLTNIKLEPTLPYVGDYAFTHKAGMHCNAVLKQARTFEHIDPSTIGNTHDILISILSGKSNIIKKMQTYYPNIDIDTENARELLAQLKEKETNGYSYELAEASFYLLCGQHYGKDYRYFDLVDYTTTTKQAGENTSSITVNVNGQLSSAVSHGVGPVNALDNALRKALAPFFPILVDTKLIDYKVRVLDSVSATSAKVRVLITFSGGGKTWSTIGVSPDIIKASYDAIQDGINYFLATSWNK